MGRAGSGPGEFQRLMALGAQGDTLFALDAVRRLTTIAPSDKASTRTVDVPMGGAIPFTARLLSGRDMIFTQAALPGQPQIDAQGQLVIRATSDGRVLDTIGALDIRDQVMRIAISAESEVQVFQPFVEIDRVAASGRGWVAIVRATDSRFNADDRVNVVEFIGPSGRSLVKLPATFNPLTDATVGRWLDIQARDLSSHMPGGEGGVRRAVASRLVRPKSHPSVRAAVIGDDGVLWLLQSPTDSPREQWTLLSPSGTSLGTVALPDGSRPLVVGASDAWVVQERDDGEMELVRYRLRR